MAKKRQPVAAPRQKEFHTSRFSDLKGFAVVDVPGKVADKPAEIISDVKADTESGMELFLQAVADVKPLHGKTKPSAAIKKLPTKKQVTAVKAKEREDNSTFIEEINRLKLDTKFSDEIPDEGELEALSGNRLRQVRRGVVCIDHQLDLHGLTREEALDALPGFLSSARNRGRKAVLVITGKGNHSQQEPVLQQAVASWMRESGRNFISEFAPAPSEMGGSGAYVVFLRAQQAEREEKASLTAG